MGHSRSEAGHFQSWKAHTSQVLGQESKSQFWERRNLARENAHQFGFEEPTLMLLSALESVERVGDGCHFLHQHLCRLHEGTESSLSSA